MPCPSINFEVQLDQILELGKASRTIAETLHDMSIITTKSKLVLVAVFKFNREWSETLTSYCPTISNIAIKTLIYNLTFSIPKLLKE